VNFQQSADQWLCFKEEADPSFVGELRLEQEGGDDYPYFYFRPAPDRLLSCRDCRKIMEKLSELNGELAFSDSSSPSAPSNTRGDV
jgi:hypothetical protein